MDRLVAFGCSHTFGQGLSDEFNNISKGILKPSKFAWPSILALKLNKDCVNLGKKGASNKEICYNILNFNFLDSDVVFILWTYSMRNCVIQDNLKIKQINVNNEHIGKTVNGHVDDGNFSAKQNDMYYKNFHTSSDNIFSDHCYFNLANYYLQNLNIAVTHLAVSPLVVDNDHPSFPVRWNKVNFLDIYHDKVAILYPTAADNNHMGEEGHVAFTNQIYKKLYCN